MGVEIQLAMADTLKRSVKRMMDVSITCYMRIRSNPNLLILGVQRDHRHGPVKIVLRHFEQFIFTRFPFRNTVFQFRLDYLHAILDRFGHDDPIRFFIADRNRLDLALDFPFMFPDGQQTVLSVTLFECGVPPYMRQQRDGVRPFRITMIADLFMEPLLYSIIHNVPMTIHGTGPVVLVLVEDQIYSYENYTSIIPEESNVQFQLEPHRAIYIGMACADDFDHFICFETADPAVNPNLPPAISFPMGREHLVYYLPFGSTASPQVYVYTGIP